MAASASHTRLPSLLLLGPNKCGTTTLHDALVQQRIACPPTPSRPYSSAANLTWVARKEVMFYDMPARYALGLEWYRSNFNRSRCVFCRLGNCSSAGRLWCNRTCHQRFIDSTASYFYQPAVAERVHAAYPRPQQRAALKLLVVLREPVDRDVSAFNFYVGLALRRSGHGASDAPVAVQLVRRSYGADVLERLAHNRSGRAAYVRATWARLGALGASNRSQQEVLSPRALEVGFYAAHLRRWLRYFEPRQLFVASFAQLVQQGVHSSAAAWLAPWVGLPRLLIRPKLPHAAPRRAAHLAGAPLVDGARVLPPDLCGRLADLYTRPNEELYRLLAAVRAVPGAASPPFPCFEQVECRDSG